MSGAAPAARRLPWLGIATVVALLTGLDPSPAAAQHPNHAQGFRPEHAFQIGEIESVNLFNGNLTLTIPIGQAYPLGPELSYGLTLVWTGNVWEWEDQEHPQNPPERYLQAVPRLRSNAGLGWTLSLGRLLRPSDVANSQQFPAYESPDQAIHSFGPGGPAEVSRTDNSTYLRHKATPNTVEHPDGTIRTFGALGGLIRLADPFGNGLDITRPFSTTYLNSGVRDWRLEDDHGRVHWVRFKPAAFYGSVVEKVELDAFGTQTAPYTFSYSEPFVPRACNEPITVGDTGNVKVPLLTQVTLPDGSAYRMPQSSYHLDSSDPCPDRMVNGHLESMELPTGGTMEWDWQVWSFPQESRHHGGVRESGAPFGVPFTLSAGLAARRHLKRNGGLLGDWTYEHDLEPAPGTIRRTESRTTVIDPLDHTSIHFFSVYHDDFDTATPEPPGWNQHEYGLPFTKRVSDGTSPGRFLSQEVHGQGGAHLRSVYVRYERDGDTVANPRMASQRTVYHDDGGRRADLNLSDFDGLGHYRQEVATGNFPGVATRTTFTNWNPDGTPADADPWVLDTYDLRQVIQDAETVTQDFWFRSDGFLRRTRTRRAAACGTSDVIVDRIAFPLNHATSPGFLAREDIYGGDGASLPCGSLAGVDLSTEPLQFRRRHTYSCGSLATSQWFRPSDDSALSFLSVDRTINCSTGLPSSSRDVSGLQASFLYDDMGRLTEEIPGAGEAKTVYSYAPESGTSRAKVAIQRKAPNGTILSGGQVEFDGFGRVEKETRDLPNGGQAERTSSWTARGDLFARTEWHAPNTVTGSTSFSQIDPFGRPRRIFLPDGFQVDIDYDGVGSRENAVPVATGLGPGGEPTFTTATTTETYDRFGRLLRLTEPNGTRTSYSYDAQGNLTRVEMNDTGTPIQVRTFTYDHRGLLRSETHPELGTSVDYSEYDALGNPRRIERGGWDLAYAYDLAGRMTEIRERGTTRVWKEWEYATANFQAGTWSNGKLATAIRHNRVFIPGTTTEIAVPVTEEYEYSGVGGRINQVTTTVGVGAVEDDTRPVFRYNLGYDALGNVSSRTQPRCDFNFCSSAGSTANPTRTVTGTFTEGLLTAVPSYASSITYHPNGRVHQVSHTNGVTDFQEKDPTDMARPARLQTSGASEDFDTGVYSWDGAGNVTKMGSFRFAYDLLSRIEEARMEVPGEGCGLVNLLTSGTETGTVTHQSCGTVQAQGSYSVGSTGNVTLRAGHRVVLGDGFSVATGGRLTLETDPSLDPGEEPTDAAQSYTYDRFGNLLSMTTELEGQSPVTRTLTTNSATNRLSVATYDSSGNVMSWAGRQYRWDPFNLLTQEKPTAGNGHTFLYSPGDERVWTIDWTAGAASSTWLETWTLRDLDGTPLRQFRQAGGNTMGTHWTFRRDYVYRSGSLLAAHTPQGVRHFHLDHLGSPRLVTDASGGTLTQAVYFPFGEEASDPGQDAPVLRFTGHERDDLDSGGTTADLDYMHARYFSAHLGRFQSVDPIGAAPTWPQSWNRYTYVLGNPVRYIDPYGLQADCFPDGICTEPIPRGFFDFLHFGSFLRNLSLFTHGTGANSPNPPGEGVEGSNSEPDDCTPVDQFFSNLGRGIESLGSVSLGLTAPIAPIAGMAAFGFSGKVTANPDGSLTGFGGLGLTLGASASAFSGSVLGRSSGTFPGGLGMRGAFAVPFIPGIPLGISGSGIIPWKGEGSMGGGIGPVAGVSGSVTYGYGLTLRDPVDPDNDPCR